MLAGRGISRIMRLPITGPINSAVFDAVLKECAPCLFGADKQLDLDLSSAEWGSPSGLVPLAALMRVLRQLGVTVQVVAYPEDESYCSYYCRMDFFKQFGAPTKCKNMKRHDGEGRFIEITELDHPEISDETKKKLAKLLQNLPGGVEATLQSKSSFIDACGELIANTRHAYDQKVDPGVSGRPPALVQAQYYPSYSRVEFCICDSGVGIKQSLEAEHRAAHPSHLDAINDALGFKNKGALSVGFGLGLAALQTYVKKNAGVLRIRTGDALKNQRGTSFAVTEHLPVWEGTIVTVSINVTKSADLSIISKRFGAQK